MASLDFSSDKMDASLATSAVNMDISTLVDKTSLGSRTRDGLYEVKDWDFSKPGGGRDDVDDVISKALNSTALNESKQVAATGTLGSSIGSLFARLTGAKTLTEEDLKPVLEAMQQHLMKKNVAKEISEKVCEGVGEGLVGKKLGSFQSMSHRTRFLSQ